MQLKSFKVYGKDGSDLLIERLPEGIALHAFPADGGQVFSVNLDEEDVEKLRDVLAKPETEATGD